LGPAGNTAIQRLQLRLGEAEEAEEKKEEEEEEHS